MGDLLCHGDTVAVIDDIEHTKLTVALQDVRHERIPINLHARVMLMSYSSDISPAISLRASGVRVFFR